MPNTWLHIQPSFGDALFESGYCRQESEVKVHIIFKPKANIPYFPCHLNAPLFHQFSFPVTADMNEDNKARLSLVLCGFSRWFTDFMMTVNTSWTTRFATPLSQIWTMKVTDRNVIRFHLQVLYGITVKNFEKKKERLSVSGSKIFGVPLENVSRRYIPEFGLVPWWVETAPQRNVYLSHGHR